ncbi:MAG: hypothetical protein WA635_03575 [Gallionella sp.]
MDVTQTYHCHSDRRFLPSQVSGLRLPFKLAECRTEAEQIHVGNVVEYSKSIDQSSGGFFIDLRQVKFASGFDSNITYIDNAVDYAEQL